MEVTQKQLDFCEEYVRNGFNGTQAYMKVYGVEKRSTAAPDACKLLRQPKIQKVLENIEGGYRQIARELEIDRRTILTKLKDIITGKKLCKNTGGELREIPHDARDVISAIQTLAKLTGDFAPTELTGLFTEAKVDWTKLSKEEKLAYKARLLKSL